MIFGPVCMGVQFMFSQEIAKRFFFQKWIFVDLKMKARKWIYWYIFNQRCHLSVTFVPDSSGPHAIVAICRTRSSLTLQAHRRSLPSVGHVRP